MDKRRKIMTIGVIGHVDHGKTTLTHAIHKSLFDSGHDVVYIHPEEVIPEVDIAAAREEYKQYSPYEYEKQYMCSPSLPDPMYLKPVKLPTLFKQPLSRRERRAQARRNK